MSTRKKAPEPGPLELFGLAVRTERKARGFSQESFADHVGVDRSYMGGVERGKRNVALANIMRIVAGLDMQPSEFFKHLDQAISGREAPRVSSPVLGKSALR